ncbi:DUF4900 domain-containing protein [Deinococcus soli (ex Cha et al. 2016)]|uniref:Uncharacterized protein n=2 Tax=Deinococcus soli (ex Cha et al. 2016) TaxID=1309411 RepID=A0ACC6KGW5_9DEIO|nr:DUF4900 domain-containing protein [Deinococcus soli (ex Cha et al. 2016)]MDR6218970.1 hypothetical protein [Deinococcus soli (ex Cha et al. 2016)]MDR6328767.1 hypothetical protein [Deinococcus soli (ex Cha et al. 2016)]MDR6751746.1 hypothetical protein [Deinococcus soli (ex Cha et al. 2016)]
MKHRDQGIAIVTVLMLMLILTAVFAIITRLTILNLQQTGDSLRVNRTLSVAQGGRNFAQSVLQGPVGAKMGDAVVNLAQQNLIGNASTWVFAAGYTTARPPANVVAQKLNLLSDDIQPRLAGGGCYGPYRVRDNQFISVRITFTGQLPSCDGEPASTIGIGEGRFLSGARNSTQEYSLPYVMVIAASEGAARRTLTVNGEYRFTVGNGSFARFALLTDQHQQSSFANIYFTSRTLFNGPVHTNGNFAFNGEPWFGGAVSSSGVEDRGIQGGYFAASNGTTAFRTPSQLNPPRYSITQPEFTNGVSWNTPEIPFPTNSNDQTAAAKTDGLFIESANSNVVLTTGVGELGTPMAGQKYQGVTVTTTTAPITTTQYRVVEDVLNGGTGALFQKSGSSWVVALNKQTPPSPITHFNGVIYGTGGINSLKGPARVPANSTNPDAAPPAVADFAQLTIVSSDDIRITGDLKYTDNPCDSALERDANGDVHVPNCSSDPLAQQNVLGIYSSGGAVRIGAGNANTSLNVPTDVQIQATLMADDTVEVENSSTVSCNLGTAYILGGVVQRRYGAFGRFNSFTGACTSGLGRSFTYDQRMLNGLAPPFFPTTQMTNLMPTRQVIQYGQSEQDRR